MGRESRAVRPRTFTYLAHGAGVRRITRVIDASGATSFARSMVRWSLDGMLRRARSERSLETSKGME